MNVLSDQNNLPGVNSDEINFHDLFEIDEVQQIQDMYSDATGVASLIIHPDGTPITRPSNFTRFCKHFTFKTEQRWAACHFAGGFKHDLSHTVNRADCLICDGLWDAGAKITVSGKHLATWIFGQVRNETSDLQRLIEDAGKAGLSSEDLPQMLNELPAMSAVQFDKVSGMLYLLANQLSQKALANLVLKKKVAEQEFTIGLLKESEERYRLLFENSGDAILFTEPNGGILTANPEACRIFDRSEEEIIEVGRNGMIDMNDPEVVTALKKREITGKFKGELNFFRKDGTIFPSEVSSSIFKDSLGNIRSSMIIHDISERKRAEVALRESEDNYRMLFNTNKDSISILRIDHNGIPANFIEANDAACELLGYTRDELFSFNIADIEVDVPRDISQKRLEALQTHGRVDFETVLKDRMGHDRILDVKVVLINYFNQPALLNITRDITDRKRAEIKLHETNAFLENLINYANAPIIVWDTHFRITRFNHAFEFLTGRMEPEVLGQSLEILFPAPLKDLSMALIHKTLTGERWETVEIKIQHLDQSIRTVLWNSATLFGTDGITPIATIAQGQDITTRKLAEEALRESEEKFREMADLLPQIIFETDENGNFVFVNRQAIKIFGYPEDFQIIGLNSLDFHIPEERERARDNIKQILSGLRVMNNEYTMVRKDGSTFQGLIYSSPITKHNKNTGLRGILVDVSELKLAGERLRESEQRYRLLIDTANEGILVGQDNMLMFINPMIPEMTGFSEQELLSIPFLDFIHPDDHELLLTNQQKRLRGDTVDLRYRIRIVTKERTIKWVEMGGVRIDWEGRPATMNFVSDITERKLAEEEIKQQNEKLRKINAEKDKFFSIIAHDLRSPFSGFLGLTQIMAEDLPSLTMAEIQEIAVSMRNSATNLFRLLENLLQWSKMQNGLIPFMPVEINLLQIVGESMAMIKEPAKNKEIEIVNHISGDLMVYADNHLLQTVFRNLLSNAVKFTPRGGNVLLSARETGNKRVEILVRDSGVGMSPLMVKKLFRLDGQTGRRGTDGEVSTGLGLLLCKEFVEKHAGELGVESVEGQGSIFYFTIPQVRPEVSV